MVSCVMPLKFSLLSSSAFSTAARSNAGASDSSAVSRRFCLSLGVMLATQLPRLLSTTPLPRRAAAPSFRLMSSRAARRFLISFALQPP